MQQHSCSPMLVLVILGLLAMSELVSATDVGPDGTPVSADTYPGRSVTGTVYRVGGFVWTETASPGGATPVQGCRLLAGFVPIVQVDGYNVAPATTFCKPYAGGAAAVSQRQTVTWGADYTGTVRSFVGDGSDHDHAWSLRCDVLAGLRVGDCRYEGFIRWGIPLTQYCISTGFRDTRLSGIPSPVQFVPDEIRAPSTGLWRCEPPSVS